MLPLAPVLAALLAVPCHQDPAPDRVELTNGRVLEGLVVFEDDETLVLRVKSRLKTVDQAKIESVTAVRRVLPEALELVSAAVEGDVMQQLLVAEQLADELNLPRESRLMYWRALTLDPSNEAAHRALGHKLRRGKWLFSIKGHWIGFAKLKQLRRDFSDAWELETTHFHVRSNLELREAIDVAFDLERAYVGFYSAFGAAFGLHELSEPIEAWVHADSKSYLYPSSARAGYFVPLDNRLNINASRQIDPRVLVHEAVHALVFNTAQRTKKRKGSIPAWLDEGLALYFGAGFTGGVGALRVNGSADDVRSYRLQANHDDPYRLNRVLNFGSSDFESPTRVGLKYSQSYSLVAFCLEGGGEQIREGFFAFVRGAYDGKGSSTHFKKALGVKQKELERLYTEFVARKARGG
ncbi:MAG: DUF1570 domain-containing protein [Planctomycetota bacterium]|nr:MAG: DUF1570 domain-containing protein [Planctomycetota bacterium]